MVSGEVLTEKAAKFEAPVVVSTLPVEGEGDSAAACVIGTHNGTFHCDEVFACCLLRKLPEYRSAVIVRTRDQKLLDRCTVVVDVGGEFNPKKHRYDHHQRGFNETFASLRKGMSWDMKLSSAGLVYVHFGERVLHTITGLDVASQELAMLYKKLYDNFVQEVDAIDNGVLVNDGDMRYSISSGLSSRVGYLNPWWNQNSSDEELNRRFVKAMELVETEFLDRLDFFRNCWWPARSVVADALAKRNKTHESGRLLVLEKNGVPWKSHLLELEREQDIVGKILYVLYADQAGNWRVQAVPVDLNKLFDNRGGLPEAWRGLRDEELAKKCGVEGAIFVHASGFIGGCNSYEGALAMAEKSLP